MSMKNVYNWLRSGINKKNNYVCVVAGKSGGHILPAVTYAQQQKSDNEAILLITTSSKLDHLIAKKQLLVDKHIALNTTYYHNWLLQYPVLCLQFLRIFCKSIALFMHYKPNKIITTGGFIAVPVCFAAKCLRIPILLFELNAQPGKAITLLSYIATNIFACFSQALKPLPSAILNPYPIRYTEKDIIEQKKAHQIIGFSPERKTLLILGGSQGSLGVNNIIKHWITDSSNIASIQIIHQIGDNESFDWKNFYQEKKIPSRVFRYCENLAPFYCAADLVISRAGAGSLFELVFFQKKAIIIPLELKSTHHQLSNAYEMQKKYPHLMHVIRQSEIYTVPDMLSEILSTTSNHAEGQLSGFAPKV